MDYKAKMDEQARLLTSMDMDAIFEKAEIAIGIAGNSANEAAQADVKDAYGVDVPSQIVHHLLVCGFSLALSMAKASAERHLEGGE